MREARMDGTGPSNRLQQQAVAAAHARGDHLLFLDWGLYALDSLWLTALLELSQQSAIGVVGAKLHYADGSLEHIGMLLGVNGVAAPACHRYPRSSPGYWGSAIAARNYSAVSGACMMTRRSVFEQVGAFREEMGGLADLDYCLRVTDGGYRVVFTPHAALVHDEAVESHASGATAEDELRFRRLWGDRLARDPYYNFNLSRQSPDYEPALTRATRTQSGSPTEATSPTLR
jgi:GT2 family glycosyltransferase